MASDTCFSTVCGRLGSVLNTDGVQRNEIDPVEARKAFDFVIERRQSYDERGVAVPGQYHLIKTSDLSFIPSCGVGRRYTPIQHSSVYDFIVERILPNFDGMRLETVGTMYGCGIGVVSATVGDEFRLPGDSSPMSSRLVFANPCNGRGSLVLGASMVRKAFQTQVSAGVRDAEREGFVVRHTRNACFHLEGALKALRGRVEALSALRRRAERLAETEVDSDFLVRVLDRVYPVGRFSPGTAGATRTANLRDDVIEQFEAGETALTMTGKTAWTAFNALAFPIFNPRSLTSRTDYADISYGGMVGDRADRVAGWFRIVEETAFGRAGEGAA